MTEDSKPATEEKIVIGANLGKEVACMQCGKKGISSDFFSYEGKKGEDLYLCHECRKTVNLELEKETKNENWGGAIGLGVTAGVVGGVIWYFIVILSGMEFGYVSIGLGYLVGLAVFIGSGKKRSVKLQILAALLTLLAIFVAEHSIFNHFLNDYLQSHLSEFPDFQPGDTISVPFFYSDFLMSLVSPISLLIYVIGVCVSFNFLKPRKL